MRIHISFVTFYNIILEHNYQWWGQGSYAWIPSTFCKNHVKMSLNKKRFLKGFLYCLRVSLTRNDPRLIYFYFLLFFKKKEKKIKNPKNIFSDNHALSPPLINTTRLLVLLNLRDKTFPKHMQIISSNLIISYSALRLISNPKLNLKHYSKN